MRHFGFLDDTDTARLFLRPPEEWDREDDRSVVAMGLGATLYSPATRPELAKEAARARRLGLTSSVLCLEDAIPDSAVSSALDNVVEQLRTLVESSWDAPMVFVRVRSADQVCQIVEKLGDAVVALTGFVLPKLTGANGPGMLGAVVDASTMAGRRLWAMPVVETPDVMMRDSRPSALRSIRSVLDQHRDHVLAVRVGATDLGAVFGLRRPRDLTVYDIRMVASAIADIVDELGRPDSGFPVTGPVWEYFSAPERLFKPLLRETPFATAPDRQLRARLIAQDLDGLIREVLLDRANGLLGKTVIHPSHVPAVHALSVVTHEEYVDAVDVLETGDAGGGVSASSYGNKMNEANPHRRWAELTALRARVFGVAREDVGFVDILGAVAD